MDDLISRQDAIEVLEWFDQTDPLGHTPVQIVRALPTAVPAANPSVLHMKIKADAEAVKKAMQDAELTLLPAEPSAQPEVKEIGYAECANAMLKMWIDNVVTDGEYNRVMDKLNTHWEGGR